MVYARPANLTGGPRMSKRHRIEENTSIWCTDNGPLERVSTAVGGALEGKLTSTKAGLETRKREWINDRTLETLDGRRADQLRKLIRCRWKR